jgi:hypothetical protein
LHRQEVADALAYWACRWVDPGPEAAVVATETDPATVLCQLPLPSRPLAGRLISQRMAAASAQPGFAAAVARMQIDDGSLERLARGAAELYAASGNFTVLHMVTACHALRVLLPCLDEPLPAVRQAWRAFAAAWVASGARDMGALPAAPWPRITRFALASDDDHVVKLVHSCREQEAAYGGAVWRQAASRVLHAGPG